MPLQYAPVTARTHFCPTYATDTGQLKWVRILNGSVQLLSWQVGGRSSCPLPNWLLTKVDEMTDLILLDQIFPGGRPTASGKHIQWDVLFIRVKPASDYLHAGSE